MTTADRIAAPFHPEPPGETAGEAHAIGTDSVAKGSIALSVSRIVGMGSGFLLFLLVAWRSRDDIGIFRTAITYLTISEFLPLLGMHRWLATEMAAQAQRRSALFRVSTAFAVGVSALMAASYCVIARIGIYSPAVSQSLLLIALAVIGSGLTICNNSALVGMGLTHRMGLLGLFENLSRSIIGIALVLSGHSILAVVSTFVAIRWITALAGLFMVTKLTAGTDSAVGRPLVRGFMG